MAFCQKKNFTGFSGSMNLVLKGCKPTNKGQSCYVSLDLYRNKRSTKANRLFTTFGWKCQLDQMLLRTKVWAPKNYEKTNPDSPISLVKHRSSSGWHVLQNSPDSVQSSTLSDPTLLFLVAVTLYQRPVSTCFGRTSVVIAVRPPPHDSLGLPATSSTARKSDLPPAALP